jgi:hypothetical protein
MFDIFSSPSRIEKRLISRLFCRFPACLKRAMARPDHARFATNFMSSRAFPNTCSEEIVLLVENGPTCHAQAAQDLFVQRIQIP